MRTSKRLPVSDKDRAILERMVRNGNTPQKTVLRARITLMIAAGITTGEIMRQLGTSTPTITRWRNRYETAGIAGLPVSFPIGDVVTWTGLILLS